MNITKSIITITFTLLFALWLITESNDDNLSESNNQNVTTKKVNEEAEPTMLLSIRKVSKIKSDKPLSKTELINKILPIKTMLIETIPNKTVIAVKTKTLVKKKPKIKKLKNYTVIKATVTAYCPCWRCCGKFANGLTSTRTSAWHKGIASDPTIIPYGTKIFIPGYGVAKVDDTGIAMRNSWRHHGIIHLDIRFKYHWQARQWGSKLMTLKIQRPSNK